MVFSKVDAFCKSAGKNMGRNTMVDYNSELEWKDGTISWLLLKKVKVINMIDVSLYARDNIVKIIPCVYTVDR